MTNTLAHRSWCGVELLRYHCIRTSRGRHPNRTLKARPGVCGPVLRPAVSFTPKDIHLGAWVLAAHLMYHSDHGRPSVSGADPLTVPVMHNDCSLEHGPWRDTWSSNPIMPAKAFAAQYSAANSRSRRRMADWSTDLYSTPGVPHPSDPPGLVWRGAPPCRPGDVE